MVLQPATVRPDHFGRTHPDPRADPPTVDLDPSRLRTDEIPVVVPETRRIAAVAPESTPQDDLAGTDPRSTDPRSTDPHSTDPHSTDPDSEADTAAIPIVDARPGSGRAPTALLGAVGALIGWFVAARLLPVDVLGEAQPAVSALLLVGGLAPLAVLPLRGRRPGVLAWVGSLLTAPSAALVGLGGALVVPQLAAAATGPGPIPIPIPGWALVAVGCAGCGVVAVQDVLLGAAGRSGWAVGRGALFVVAQIGALVALCGFAGFAAHGVVLSWLGAIGVCLVAGLVLVPVLVRKAPAPGEGASGMPAAISLVGPAMLYHLVPIVVTVRFGPDTGATFFVAWQLFVVVDLAAAHTVHALSGAVAREPDRTTELVARARKRLLVVFLPVIALGVALAGPLLSAFGANYTDADDLLRLLLLGLAFRLVVTHELGVRQALGHGVGYDRLQLFSAVLVLVVAIALPHTTVGVTDLRLTAIGYIIVQVACAAAVLVIPAARRTDVEVRAP
ncbi:hypothetical protein GCM10009559_12790 [Pseudonocardia zijingensis]|uniref:O-antigen/teichoic acid export membrane protein n=1 Tax=Pseudonocardia zijingensis TaxID=153376 RepID=A0ABP3ZXR5_9PSEU